MIQTRLWSNMDMNINPILNHVALGLLDSKSAALVQCHVDLLKTLDFN